MFLNCDAKVRRLFHSTKHFREKFQIYFKKVRFWGFYNGKYGIFYTDWLIKVLPPETFFIIADMIFWLLPGVIRIFSVLKSRSYKLDARINHAGYKYCADRIHYIRKTIQYDGESRFFIPYSPYIRAKSGFPPRRIMKNKYFLFCTARNLHYLCNAL